MLAKTRKEVGVIEITTTTNVIENASIMGRINTTLASISAGLINSFVGKWLFIDKLKTQTGLNFLMSFQIEDEETFFPIKSVCPDDFVSELVKEDEISKLLGESSSTGPFRSVTDYVNAYKNMVVTPVDVIDKIIEFLESEKGKNLNAIIEYHSAEMRQAAVESTERFKACNPRSILEGVPFVVKESIKMKGYKSLSGINNPESKPSEETNQFVQRLLDAGAIMIGAANMTQCGYGTMGFNPSKLHGPVRNPYNTGYYVGGSSTGTAGAIAAGLVPFGIAVDGLGSGRIPAATAGIVGLKSTFSRMYNDGVSSDLSYIVSGPMATNVRDTAIIYGFMAGPNERYSLGLHQPAVELPDLKNNLDLSTIRWGMDFSLTKMAKHDQLIKSIECFIDDLRKKGCTVLDYCIPEMRENIAAMITIISKGNKEMYKQHFGEFKVLEWLNCVNARIIYALACNTTEEEAQQARRQTTRAMKIVEDIFEKIDILILPTIAGVAEKIEQGDDDVGVVDDIQASRYTRFCALGSLTGIPSISLNIGYTENHLPIALQLSAAWWNEKLLLEVSQKIEEMFSSSVANPVLHHVAF